MWKRLNKTPLFVAIAGFAVILSLALIFGVGCAAPQPAYMARTDAGAALHWATMPVKVKVMVADPAWSDAVAAGINAWNDALGFEAFISVQNATEAVAGVLAGDCDDDPGSLASTTRTARVADGVMLVALVCLPEEPFDAQKRRNIAEHELGHLLGLAHDLNPDSIMYAYAEGASARRTIHAGHVRVLCEVYGC